MGKVTDIKYAKTGSIFAVLPVILYLVIVLASLIIENVSTSWFLLMTFFVLSLLSLFYSVHCFFLAAKKQNKLYYVSAIIILFFIVLFLYFGALAYKL